MIHRPDIIKINEYFEAEAVNATALKHTLVGVKGFETKTTSRAMELGNTVEALLMYEKDELPNLIKISEVKIPTGKTGDVIKEYVTNYDEYDSNKLIEICDKVDFHSNKKRETRIGYVEKALIDELERQKLVKQGYIVVSKDEYNKALKLARWVEETFWWKELLKSDEVWFQLPIYAEYEGVKYKGLLDIVTVNNNFFDKQIYIWDLKTTGVLLRDFGRQYKNMHYDLQLALYTRLYEFKYDMVDDTKLAVVSSTAPPAVTFSIGEDIREWTMDKIHLITEDYLLMKKYDFKREPIKDSDVMEIKNGIIYKNGQRWT